MATEAKAESVDLNKEESQTTERERRPTLWNELMKFRHSDEGKTHLLTNIFKFEPRGHSRKRALVSVVWNEQSYHNIAKPGETKAAGWPGKAYHRIAFKIFTAYGCTVDQLKEGNWKENEEALQAAFAKMCAWNAHNAMSHFLSNDITTNITSHENGSYTANLVQNEEIKCSATGPTIQQAKHALAIAFFAEGDRTKRYSEWLRKKRSFKDDCQEDGEKSKAEMNMAGFFSKHHQFGKKKLANGKVVQKHKNIWKQRVLENDDGTFEASFCLKTRGADIEEASRKLGGCWKGICRPKREAKGAPMNKMNAAGMIMGQIAKGKSPVQLVNEYGQKEGVTPGYTVVPIDATNKSLGYSCMINYGNRLTVSGMGQDMNNAKKNAAMMLFPMLFNSKGGKQVVQQMLNRKRKGGKPRHNNKKKKTNDGETANDGETQNAEQPVAVDE